MTPRHVLGVLAVLTCSLAHAPAHGVTVLVKADGTGQAATIQAAVDAANSGDTVLLAPDTYTLK